MDINLVISEIQNPAMKELVKEILDTVEKVKAETKDYRQAMAELSGYKQVIQVMALEMMRQRVPITGRV